MFLDTPPYLPGLEGGISSPSSSLHPTTGQQLTLVRSLWSRKTWERFLDTPPPSCVTWSGLPDLSEHQVPHHKMRRATMSRAIKLKDT